MSVGVCLSVVVRCRHVGRGVCACGGVGVGVGVCVSMVGCSQ